MRTYTDKELAKMPAEEVKKLVSIPGVKIKGTAVVRDKHGNIKEDRTDGANARNGT